MGYHEDPAQVRVDFFKPSGKWYAAESMHWESYTGEIHATFAANLKAHLGGRLAGMTAVCLKPYHEYAHPLMMKVPVDV